LISKTWDVLALGLLLSLRLVIQLALYKAGFISLTADEFGRTIAAAIWSQHPTFELHGIWLPFHTYFIGTALLIKWELLWLPRLITILMGLASIVLMYLLASSLFDSRKAGLVSAFLLSVNPAHIWLSGAPLTEIPNAMLVLAAIYAFSLYLKSSKRSFLYTAACILAVANGFRFESWLISLMFSLTLLGLGLLGIIQKKIHAREMLNLIVAAFIPWLFPLGWVVGNYLETQNPFYFSDVVRDYNLLWYGREISYTRYLETFLKIDPYLTFLGVAGVISSYLLNKRSQAVKWYVAVSVLPLVAYILLQGGQPQPPGNYIRYFAQFSFLFYPAFGYLWVQIDQALHSRALKLVPLLFLTIVAITQLRAAFRFTNDPAAEGLAVGLVIRELRAQNPEISGQPVVIELSYWQYLAIHVGANDIDRIVYDRAWDIASRSSQPLLMTDESLFQSCLKLYDISYVVVKEPELRSVMESKLQLQPVNIVNGYAFYPVSAGSLADVPADPAVTCPLPFGSGY
jgi:hypothetical protein